MSAVERNNNERLLTAACRILGLVDGCLLPATPAPTEDNLASWTDKGDWLGLAAEVGAEKVFFVDNEPILVLAELPEDEDAAELFNRVWSMARPQILFLAREGELAVYRLGASPVRADEALDSGDRLLALAKGVADIATNLASFRRESIETGQVYGDERFGDGAGRADRTLVRDLKAVRVELTKGPTGLKLPIAHSLIGRALFVRYLEDRAILVREYFEAVASARPEWQELLDQEPRETFADPRLAQVMFFRVLKDKDFAYAFFAKLASDFNGDTFPVSLQEEAAVNPEHLELLRALLVGNAPSAQGRLFLFAYRFDIIPIELISNIYENFYAATRGKGNTQSSYYTPPALVDFLLSRALTVEVLDGRPRVTDAACGSGIFLVETFRRMVRHRVARQRRRLSQRELRVILRDQIRGIDLNPEAVPIAAFSLYLAYLHYQNPREVNERRKLPNLRWDPERAEARDPDQHFDILFAGNAFDAITQEDPVVRRHFGPGSADVVVGNPPWGAVASGDKLGQAALRQTMRWCADKSERIIGDKEMSQAFVHLALELLPPDRGRAALLLSSGGI
ncbi:N-6 DNA methylase [Polyangium jinanense]|uniref:site-specific DNA-methyltransferase (adenine-specific) n=1 Tax=Polyangium jinanense TaxID=2829994 RepID=A0A9X4AYP1_9BACT|nr:N-6 DNA methylase [Polyangium jinanense]MDC3987307.1 N-6 DNA methylase [Polyangium jinanense]